MTHTFVKPIPVSWRARLAGPTNQNTHEELTSSIARYKMPLPSKSTAIGNSVKSGHASSVDPSDASVTGSSSTGSGVDGGNAHNSIEGGGGHGHHNKVNRQNQQGHQTSTGHSHSQNKTHATSRGQPSGRGGALAPSAARAKMGNGASSNAQFTVDGEVMDLQKVKAIVPELRQELKRRDKLIEQYDSQVRHAEEVLRDKDAEISRLKEEVHKLKSVLQLKVDALKNQESKPDLLSTIDENQTEPKGPAKKQGVSGESPSSQAHGYVDLTHHEKDFK